MSVGCQAVLLRLRPMYSTVVDLIFLIAAPDLHAPLTLAFSPRTAATKLTTTSSRNPSRECEPQADPGPAVSS
ncbi:hypothetical protein KC347_g290 [Hortaea werneckii]|nr:hypothetical protein KC347_g290 [Hortaea werneckii]